MNREQRRKQRKEQQKSTVLLPIDQMLTPEQLTPDMRRNIILKRIQLNLKETKHPFHHKTANGTIVDADPTLEYFISLLTDAPQAVPVDRDYYRHHGL
jgi:hypothetical protein